MEPRRFPVGELLKPTLIVGMAAALGWMFGTIVFADIWCFREPNTLILVLEGCLVSAIFVYGLVSFVQVLRRIRK